jgi:hypothetical protein
MYKKWKALKDAIKKAPVLLYPSQDRLTQLRLLLSELSPQYQIGMLNPLRQK